MVEYYLQNSKTESVMYFNVSSSNSVCIGNETTEAQSFSVTGKSPAL